MKEPLLPIYCPTNTRLKWKQRVSASREVPCWEISLWIISFIFCFPCWILYSIGWCIYFMIRWCNNDSENRNRTGCVSEIEDCLYVSDAFFASSSVWLHHFGISHIVNCTPNLPNYCQSDPTFHYLRLPLQDHLEEDLTRTFTSAILFI